MSDSYVRVCADMDTKLAQLTELAPLLQTATGLCAELGAALSDALAERDHWRGIAEDRE